jgi:hypothetical protein
MRKFFICFMAAFTMFGSLASAQVRTRGRGNGFVLSSDEKERIRAGCQDMMKAARTNTQSRIERYCAIDSIQLQEADLGPWKKFVDAMIKVFAQFRRLAYVAAVFMVLWILAKAMYEGEMHWEHIGMLVIGVAMLAMAEVFLDVATNKVSIDDIRSGEIYVDCREPDKGLYKCSREVEGSLGHESKYMFPVNPESSGAASRRGLF